MAKSLLLLAALVAVAAADLSHPERFNLYKNEFNKVYESELAAMTAFEAWVTNEAIIVEHNAKDSSYKLGHNEYSDMSWEDFADQMLGGFDGEAYLNRPKNYDYTLANNLRGANNTAIDWVTKGAVTPVKNQAQCGSCWAFSTTGSLEGAYQIATGTLVSLSEQDLVSCDTNGDNGCNGGLMDNAFGWILKNGICTEGEYPYTSGTGASGTCVSTCTPAVTLTGHTDVPKGDEKSLLSAATIGPVSVAIEADKSAFQLYKSGVLDSTGCGNKLDHGVLVVGYGTDSTVSKPYWKVKNSWGATWGEKGYLRMVRNKDMCGVADSASYPTGAKKMAPGPAPGPSPGPAPGPSPPGPSPAPTDCLENDSESSCDAETGCHWCSWLSVCFDTPCTMNAPLGFTN